MTTPSYREELISQVPALQVLMQLGYEYLTPDEALAQREGRKRNVLLSGVLAEWLRAHNTIEARGQVVAFSEANIREAVRRVSDVGLHQGLLRANEAMVELLTLGTSLKQTVTGDTKSHTLHYIDWAHPGNNVYHVTEEFSVERAGSTETRRPDIVVFVNGIPLVVIECKRPDKEAEHGKAVEEAVSQMIRNQSAGEIPHLFVYSQMLLAISKNDVKYATTGTDAEFWTVWKEEDAAAHEAATKELISRPLSEAQKAHLYDWRRNAYWVRREFDAMGERLPTAQDRALLSLLYPARLLELTYQYLVFDGGQKKIARYQQYFAIQATLNRVAHLNAQGRRTGGVIWHTTGSGKSLTMVMLAKALALHPAIRNPRVVLVTDRINLDDQIYGTFKACGKSIEQAESGKDLTRLIAADSPDIIATTVFKFETAAEEHVANQDTNVFMLVDESHRTQYGRVHSMMRQVFQNACYIGFTGTPLTRSEKNTAAQFGGFIHKYTMRQAVEDKTVVPLLYEGRLVELGLDRGQLDRWFARHTEGLTAEQQADLKRKMSRNEEISRVDQRIQDIAWDITQHFQRNLQGTGFKAQLATASKSMALRYKHYLDEFEGVTAEVVISGPDMREGYTEVDDPDLPAVQAFWKRMMERFGTEEAYNREVLRSFHERDGLDLLIVVDKLLVGFDEPRNTVLYIDKQLKEHGLLQAIARVNRLFEGKDFGTIIDYRGVLGELNEAMQTYNALEEYDPEDIAGTITDVAAEIEKLPQLHSDLWAVFNGVNTGDTEAMERFLEPEDVRHRFYTALTDFARSLKVALSTVAFYEDTPEKIIDTYKHDLQFFHNLRMSVKLRYAEVIDYKDYELKIRKLLSGHISARGTQPITELVNIFDQEAFDREVERVEGAAAKADRIAYRLKRTITENMQKDPALYRKFSTLIDETIAAYRQGRIDEAAYLEAMVDALDQVRAGRARDLPAQLSAYRDAPAYFGILKEGMADYTFDSAGEAQHNILADTAIEVEGIIEGNKIRDWVHNADIHSQIKLAIDEYLFEMLKAHGVAVDWDDLEMMIDQIVDVARKRDNR